jgi:chaperonin GroES
MNIKPLADRVLIKPAPAEEKTGNGTKDEEIVVAVGNQVLYGKYAGTELEWEGEKYLIMRQSDILAII